MCKKPSTSENVPLTHDQFVDITGLEFQSEGDSLVRPGVYRSVDSLVDEINNLQCVKNHLSLSIQRGGFVEIARICDSDRCSSRLHKLGRGGVG